MFNDRLQSRIVLRSVAQQSLRLGQNRENGGFGFIKCFVTSSGRIDKFSGVGENTQTLTDVVRLAGFGIGFLNFVMLKTQKVETFHFPCMFCGEFGQFALRSLNGKKKGANFGRESNRIRKRIDKPDLVRVVQQGLLFVLAMDIEQARRQFSKRRYSAGLVVDVNAVAIAGRNLAADDDLRAFAVKTEAFEFFDPIVGETSIHTLDDLKRRRLNEVAFALAKLTLERYFRDEGGNGRPWLFPQC